MLVHYSINTSGYTYIRASVRACISAMCVFVQFRVRMRGMHMGDFAELRLRSDRVNELAHVQLRSRILRTVLLHNFMLFIYADASKTKIFCSILLFVL